MQDILDDANIFKYMFIPIQNLYPYSNIYALSISTVKKWAAEFKSGVPCHSRMTHVKENQKLQLHWKLSKRSVWNILHEELGMRKPCTRWVPPFANAQTTFAAIFGPIQEGSD
ncbi:hypothetical protein LAZ67_18001827 [Cordylochernes scorpioides]|uniref:Uncharacterized protein n=1 Tax=Cordylochernes scorpioides TaxID=51811 RepID=A0ABY6LHL5_9ARAC|nr:hypothetical protein LAZ67_18001827 [Cordylochernes scorpioides]